MAKETKFQIQEPLKFLNINQHYFGLFPTKNLEYLRIRFRVKNLKIFENTNPNKTEFVFENRQKSNVEPEIIGTDRYNSKHITVFKIRFISL